MEKTADGRPLVWIRNMTSVPYYLASGGGNPVCLAPFSSIKLKGSAKERVLEFEVVNMFHSKDKHPKVVLSY